MRKEEKNQVQAEKREMEVSVPDTKPTPLANKPIKRLPLPEDGPLLSFEDVAAYLRRTVGAVRKMVDGRSDGDDKVGKKLRQWVVSLSPHRRYILADPFRRWLAEKASAQSVSEADTKLKD